MDSPVIRPGSSYHRSHHERPKISPIYKWLGLTHRGQVRHRKVRALYIGIGVGLVTSLVAAIIVVTISKPPTTQSQVNIPGKRVKPLK